MLHFPLSTHFNINNQTHFTSNNSKHPPHLSISFSLQTNFKMVAIQTLLTLAMAMMATAAPTGSINTNIRFFRIDDFTCDAGGQQIDQASIFNPPLTAGQLGINTCIQHSAWGSIVIDQIGTGATGCVCEFAFPLHCRCVYLDT